MILHIAFDGIHKSGKSYHLRKTKELLDTLGITNVTIRGEYNRPGLGENPLEDPFSLRRQKNRFSENYDEKSERINRELLFFSNKYFPNYLKKIGQKNGVILLDRSIVGKYLFDHSEGLTTKEIINTSKKNNSSYNKNKIIPDLIFILKPTKEELLKRLQNTFNPSETDSGKRFLYKKEFINNKYKKYYKGIKIIPNHIKKRIILIKNKQEKKTIEKEIISKIKELLSIKQIL